MFFSLSFFLGARLRFYALSEPSYRCRRVVTSNPTGPSLSPLTRPDIGRLTSRHRANVVTLSIALRSQMEASPSPRRVIEKQRETTGANRRAQFSRPPPALPRAPSFPLVPAGTSKMCISRGALKFRRDRWERPESRRQISPL